MVSYCCHHCGIRLIKQCSYFISLCFFTGTRKKLPKWKWKYEHLYPTDCDVYGSNLQKMPFRQLQTNGTYTSNSTESQVKFKSKKSWAQGYSFLTACLSQYQSTKRYLSRINVYQIITIVTIMSLSDIQLTQILIDITQLITKIYINMIIVLCKKYVFPP